MRCGSTFGHRRQENGTVGPCPGWQELHRHAHTRARGHYSRWDVAQNWEELTETIGGVIGGVNDTRKAVVIEVWTMAAESSAELRKP
jgi:hypothetical protein